MIGQVVSHYRILNRLGAGGMGIVYAAEDLILHRRVAIKFSSLDNSNSLKDRLLEEARLASTLDHPNIARIYDCGDSNGHLFVVMQLIEGQTLTELLTQGPLPPVKAIHIAEDVLVGLEEAHRCGIIHRDIKPSNVMIDSRGTVKILDFGLSKRQHPIQLAAAADQETVGMDAYSGAHLTIQGQILGTPPFMSPEHVRGTNIDARSDLFSVATMLYTTLTGHSPFLGASSAEVMANVLHFQPSPLAQQVPGLTTAFDALLRKAFDKDPNLRYQTAAEFRTELAQFRTTLTGSTGLLPTPITTSSTFTIPRRAWWGLAALPFAGFAIWRYTNPTDKPTSPEALRWYDLGVAALRDGTYYSATTALTRALSIDPEFTLAHARLAEAWSELDSLDRSQGEMLLALGHASRSSASSSTRLTMQAIQASIVRDFPTAIARYESLLNQSAAAAKPQLWLDLGRIHEKANNMSRALECYTEAARDSQYAAAFLRRGTLLGFQGKMDQAEKDLLQAQSIYESSRNFEGLAEVHFQRGRRLASRRSLVPARESLEDSIQLAIDFGLEFQRLRGELQLSVVTYLEGNSAAAQQLAQSVIVEARQLRLPYLTIRGLIDLGNAQLAKLDITVAETTLREAVDLANRDKLPRSLATAQLTLASILLQASKFEDAENFIKPALDFYTKNQFEDEIAVCQTLLARIYRSRGKFDQMHQVLAEQLKKAESAGNNAKISTILGEIANAYAYQENLPEALRAFERRFEITKDSKVVADIGYSLSGQVLMLARLGEPARAKLLFEELKSRTAASDLMTRRIKDLNLELLYFSGAWAQAIATATQLLADPSLTLDKQLMYRAFRANSLSRLGKSADALKELTSLLEASKQSQDTDRLESLRLIAAEVYLRANQPAEAMKYAIEARQYSTQRQLLLSALRSESLIAGAATQLHTKAATDQARAAAGDLSKKLESQWGPASFKKYLISPDASQTYKHLLM